MNDTFRQIQAIFRVEPDSLEKAAFLRVSFDPEQDTPVVLKQYTSIYTRASPQGQPVHWQFAVPTTKDLPDLAYFFGLVYQPDKAQIVHFLSTTPIGPAGTIENYYSGNAWTPAGVANPIKSSIPRS